MDFSKKDVGGTRIHDHLHHRTIATGMGQTVGANKRTGADRAIDVANKMGNSPLNKTGDPGRAALKTHQDLQSAAAQRSMNLCAAPDSPCSPLQSSQSKGFMEATSGGKATESPSTSKPGPRRLSKPSGAVQSGV